MIKNFAQVTFLVTLAVAGNAATAFAQPTNRFHRVTTTAQPAPADRENADAASRDPRLDSTAKQNATTAKKAATTPRRRRQNFYRRLSGAPSLFGSGPKPVAGSRIKRSPSPHPAPEAEPVSRPARTASPPRSHNYYPGLRSGVGPSQPVRLSTRPARTPMNPGCTTTGGQATSRAAGMPGMAHHR